MLFVKKPDGYIQAHNIFIANWLFLDHSPRLHYKKKNFSHRGTQNSKMTQNHPRLANMRYHCPDDLPFQREKDFAGAFKITTQLTLS